MAAKWLKEHNTRERVIDVLILEQFVTVLPEGSEYVIAGRLVKDCQQAKKTVEEDPIRIKEKCPEGGKHCLV